MSDRQWLLATRPAGMVTESDFELNEVLVAPRYGEATEALRAWVADGSLAWKADIQQGFERIPKTPIRLSTGGELRQAAGRGIECWSPSVF